MARGGSTHPDGEAGRRWRRSHLQTWAGTAGQDSRHKERDREGGDVRWRLGRAGCCRRWPWRRFSSTPCPDPTILDDDRRLSLESAVVLLRGLTTDPLCLRVQSLGGEGCSLLPHGHFWIASQRVMALGRVGPTAASFFAARSSTTRTPSSCPASSTCMRISTSPDGRSGRASAPAQEPPPQLVHDVLKKYAGMKGPPTFHFQIETREKHYWVTHQTSDGAGGGGDGRACRWRWWRAVASVEGSEIGGKCRMTSREAEGKIVHTHVLDGQIQLRWDVRAHLDGNGGNRIGVLNMLSVFCTKLFPICSMFSSYAIIHHICIARLCALICFHVCSMRISLHFVKHGCVSFSLAHNS